MSEVTEETPDVVEEPDEEPVEEEGTEEDIPFEEPEEQAEPEPEPPAAHGRSERELEAIRKKLDTSANTWRRRVEELLGEDFAALTPCELCGDDIPGFHWPAELLQPDNEIQERLLAVLRQPAVMTYNPDPDTRECDRCSGKGKLELPGIVPGNETKVCGQCKGYGYIPPPVPTGNGYADVAQVTPSGINAEDAEPPQDADIWGSPRLLPDGQENPNYGKMPQYKMPTLP
jgi:hypothetical protein